MKLIAEVEFSNWDKKIEVDVTNQNVMVSDFIIIKNKTGTDIAKIIKIKQTEDNTELTNAMIRKASDDDLYRMNELQKEKKQVIDKCKELIQHHNLEMKLIDVRFTFDGGHIIFAFAADGRIDFRDLVKDLTRHFKKSIRLHQIGIRDEIKITGDIGACGRHLCCGSFLKDLKSITSDLAEKQQVAHRGSERISGVCGRLRCCLEYEEKGYEEIMKTMPPIGTIVKTSQGKGEVLGWHTLKQTVDVLLVDNETIVEVPIKELKRKK